MGNRKYVVALLISGAAILSAQTADAKKKNAGKIPITNKAKKDMKKELAGDQLSKELFLRGKAAYVAGETADALELFQRAKAVKFEFEKLTAVNTKKTAKRAAFFDFNIAKCQDKLNRFEEAVMAYEKYLLSRPPDALKIQKRIKELKDLVADGAISKALMQKATELERDGKLADAVLAYQEYLKHPLLDAVAIRGHIDELRGRIAELAVDESRLKGPPPPPPPPPPKPAPPPPPPPKPVVVPKLTIPILDEPTRTERFKTFVRRHKVPVILGVGALVLAGTGLALSLSVGPDLDDYKRQFSACPSCDFRPQIEELRNRNYAGIALMSISGAAAVATVATAIYEWLKDRHKIAEPRVMIAPSSDGLVIFGRF